MIFRLFLVFAKWVAWIVWRRLDRPSQKRLPGRLLKAPADYNTKKPLLTNLPQELIRNSLLPFLTTKDVVYLESVACERTVVILHGRLRSAEVILTNETARPAVDWLYARKISPKKITVAANVTEARTLQSIAAIVGDTESCVLKASIPDGFAVTTILIWRFGERLRELDLHLFPMWDEVLVDIQGLTHLELLRFALGPLCTMQSVAVTLDALPQLRDFGMHQCSGSNFTVQYARLIAERCTKLNSLALTRLFPVPAQMVVPQSSSFIVPMAPYWTNLHTLDLSLALNLTTHDAHALAQHCGNLQRLSIFRGLVMPAFTPALAEVMHKLPHLQFLDVSAMNGCQDVLIVAVARHCPQLRQLFVTACSALTDASIAALTRFNPPLLTDLQCAQCPRLTKAALEALQKVNPGVHICGDVYHTGHPSACAHA